MIPRSVNEPLPVDPDDPIAGSKAVNKAGAHQRFLGHMSVEVTLSDAEIQQAMETGSMRYIHTLRGNVKRKESDLTRIGWLMMHAIAEQTVASYIGEYWSGKWGNPDEPGPAGMYVRYSQPHWNFFAFDPTSILVHKGWIVGVTGAPPLMRILGAIHLKTAMDERFTQYSTDRNTSFQKVPCELLKPLDTILQ